MKANIVEVVHLKLSMSESNQLFDAISRITKNTDKESIERFAEQDKMIFMKTLNALEGACRDL